MTIDKQIIDQRIEVTIKKLMPKIECLPIHILKQITKIPKHRLAFILKNPIGSELTIREFTLLSIAGEINANLNLQQKRPPIKKPIPKRLFYT